MVTDVTKFHKSHLGGRGMLECMCVCRVSYRILSIGRRGTLKFGVNVEGVYSTYQLGGVWGHIPPDFVTKKLML